MDRESDSMPDGIGTILQLLEEGRDAQAKANEILGEVRVDVAGVKRALKAQQEGMVELRRQQIENSDRLRSLELQLARLPHTEREVGRLHAKQDKLEERVGALEKTGVRTEVVTGAVTGSAKEMLKHVVSGVAGAAAAVFAWMISKGG